MRIRTLKQKLITLSTGSTIMYFTAEQNGIMELENQLSLIEKLYFQLTKDPEYRVTYFDNYLAHEFFNDDEEWVDYPSYANVKNVIMAYKAFRRT